MTYDIQYNSNDSMIDDLKVGSPFAFQPAGVGSSWRRLGLAQDFSQGNILNHIFEPMTLVFPPLLQHVLCRSSGVHLPSHGH